jgi:hypothetical protein
MATIFAESATQAAIRHGARHYLCCDEYVHEEMPPDPICDPICPWCDTRAPEPRLSHRMGADCFDGTCFRS